MSWSMNIDRKLCSKDVDHGVKNRQIVEAVQKVRWCGYIYGNIDRPAIGKYVCPAAEGHCLMNFEDMNAAVFHINDQDNRGQCLIYIYIYSSIYLHVLGSTLLDVCR